MRFEKKYAGKWVAARNDKVVASAKSLTKLKKELKGSRKDLEEVRFALVPKGYIAG